MGRPGAVNSCSRSGEREMCSAIAVCKLVQWRPHTTGAARAMQRTLGPTACCLCCVRPQGHMLMPHVGPAMPKLESPDLMLANAFVAVQRPNVLDNYFQMLLIIVLIDNLSTF